RLRPADGAGQGRCARVQRETERSHLREIPGLTIRSYLINRIATKARKYEKEISWFVSCFRVFVAITFVRRVLVCRAPCMTVSTASFLRQGERDDLVIGDLRPGEPAARAHHGDELPSIGSSVRDRRRFNRRRQLDFPQLLAGRGGKGAE